MIPYMCPICCGTGNVRGGFYNCYPVGIPTSTVWTEMCRACDGGGVIYGKQEGGLKEGNTPEETEKIYQYEDTEDNITVLKDIRKHLLTIIEELQRVNRNI